MLERTDLDHAGVIDEHVEAAPLGDHVFDDTGALAAFGEIAHQHGHADAAALEIDARRIQLHLVPGSECDVRSQASQLARDGEAETARTAGNERAASL